MKRSLLTILVLLLSCYVATAQAEKKKASACRISEEIRIDGNLDERAWDSASPATDIIQYEPYNGRPATMRTEVRFLYDQTGLYCGAILYDPNPDSIPTQLGLRDSDGLNCDYFFLGLSPFDDGINAFCFQVWASDVQSDFKLTEGAEDDEDWSWDAIWQSKARITPSGWVVEMKIPYSAVRFPKTPIQSWGINIIRSIRRTREKDSWNLIDSKIQGVVNQSGLLEGIHDIKPPLRLSVTPYVSGYVEKNPDNPDWQFSYNYGADLKYGINQSFTLDMTLIPDFGQVASDDNIYNFTPFEIRYEEKRQFFTEGTELFNKGGIFYSRRIGSEPKKYDSVYDRLGENEEVTENPMQTRLINATKISGRTTGGLGIGFFNAMSSNTWASILDTVTGEGLRYLTQGFTNYNMIVFDQNLPHNSFFDVMNTNYYMPTEGYTANVSGINFKFANKKYTYALFGDGYVSQKYYSHASPDFGYRYSLAVGKIAGNFQFTLSQLMETDRYDINDMGFNTRNNKFNNAANFNYNIYEPFWKVLNWYNWLRIGLNYLYDGLKYTSLTINAQSVTTSTKWLTFGMNFESCPIPGHDYYEPRVDGWMFISPAYANLVNWISTDYRKTLAVDLFVGGYLSTKYKASGIGMEISPRVRFSDRISLRYVLSYNHILNDVGYVMDSTDLNGDPVIIFGRRDQNSVVNILTLNYMLTSKMSINFRLRHYWMAAPYYAYYRLREDGTLDPSTYNTDSDVNFNQFNIDFDYIWNFAPGSQLSVMWKNAITTFSNDVEKNYFNDLNLTLASPSSNSFSIRFLYYIDALYFKKKKPKTDL